MRDSLPESCLEPTDYTINVRRRGTSHRTCRQVRRATDHSHSTVTGTTVPYVLILVPGLRKGDRLGLGWADIDLDTGTVLIDWQIQRVGRIRGIEGAPHQGRLVRTSASSSNVDRVIRRFQV